MTQLLEKCFVQGTNSKTKYMVGIEHPPLGNSPMENPNYAIEFGLNKIFGQCTQSFVKVSFILSKIDTSINNTTDREIKFSSKSLINLYLYKRIKSISNYPNLIKSLIEEDALNLGFYKDENNNLILPKKRTFNYFLQNNKGILNDLDRTVERILVLATKNNVVLDIQLVKKVIKNKSEENYKKNQAIKETIKLIKKLIYPQIEIKINHNAKFTTKDLLDILVHVAYSHDFINNGTATFEQIIPNEKTPNPDTILYHFKKFDNIDNIELMFRNIFDFIFNFANKNYRLLNRRELDIAIDIHKIPYYGKLIEPNYIKSGIQDGAGTTKFIHFITCSIVVAGKRFTIDAIPIHFSDSLEELVKKLIRRAKSKIRIRHVYLDRGFDRTEVIEVLKKNNVKFIMPKIKTPTVKDYYDKSEACKSRVIKDFKIGDKTTVNLYLVDDEDGIKRAFSTNLDIPEQLAHYLFRFYKFRWGIETSYRQMDHDFLARTTSRNFHLRLFYFLFSVCLLNLWVLVNLCVSLKVYGRLSETPVITAKLFAVFLYKIQEEYKIIDPGG